MLGWHAAPGPQAQKLVAGLFVVNVVLNVGWSYFFFFSRRPDLALREVAALWLSIAALIAVLAGSTTLGAALLVPYLLWVSFAAYLNLTIVRLNGAFA